MTTAASEPNSAFQDSRARLYKMIGATSIGNALEWYDIVIYGFFAVQVSRAFFPEGDDATALLLTLGTFAISFLSRPIGAIVLGTYADKVGRKASMLASIMLMMIGTAMIVFMPTYSTIGILAPIGILIARLIQGFSAGGEFGSSTALLVELAPQRRGYMASWQYASQGLTTLLASAAGVLVTAYMPSDTIQAWGWRVPFAFGLLVGPVGLYIRRNLEEQPVEKINTVPSPLFTILTSQIARLLAAIGAIIGSTSVSYLLVYMPIYAEKELGLGARLGFVATLLASVILIFLTPITGHLSDWFGRTRLMLISATLLLFSFYPCFVLMSMYPSATTIIGVTLWLAALKATYCGALPALMSELFPKATRATGMSLSQNIGIALFGGLGPFMMTWLTNATGSKLAPSYYLTAITLLCIVGLLGARRILSADK